MLVFLLLKALGWRTVIFQLCGFYFIKLGDKPRCQSLPGLVRLQVFSAFNRAVGLVPLCLQQTVGNYEATLAGTPEGRRTIYRKLSRFFLSYSLQSRV